MIMTDHHEVPQEPNVHILEFHNPLCFKYIIIINVEDNEYIGVLKIWKFLYMFII